MSKRELRACRREIVHRVIAQRDLQREVEHRIEAERQPAAAKATKAAARFAVEAARGEIDESEYRARRAVLRRRGQD